MLSSSAMAIPRLPALVLAAALAAGCAGPASSSADLLLGPGGRAEARIDSTPRNRLLLANRGPGRVDFTLRTAGGRPLASGALGVSHERWSGEDPEPLLLVLEAHPDDGGATVAWTLEGEGGVGILWDLSRAHP